MLLLAVLDVPIAVIIQEMSISADEKGAGTAGGVQDLKLFDLLRSFAFADFPHGVFNDVVHNIDRGVIDASCLLNLRLLLNFGLVTSGKTNDFTQELLVDVAKDVSAQDRELIGAFRIVKASDDVFKNFVVNF